jgi:8-oxo-dGTP diphosphatase
VTPIETKRLILRRYEESDAAALVRLVNDWDVSRWLPHVPHPYAEPDARDFIASAQALLDDRREYQLAITLKDGTLIGTTGVHVASRSIPELGYWLGKRYWGRGFATETAAAMVNFSFKTLGLDMLMARVFDGNTASERVLVKLGFALIEIREMETDVRGHSRYTVYHRHAG